jgi:hypothetical protein
VNEVLLFITTITVAQLIAHLIGDYLLQSSWMAVGKVKALFPATIHSVVYSIPFVVLFAPSLPAWLVIVGTHIIIDRYRLAKHVCWLKNWLAPKRPRPFAECKDNNGFEPDTPEHVSFWLMVITDNVMHILINGAALYFLS